MNNSIDIKRFGQLLLHDVRSCPEEYKWPGLWMSTAFPFLMVLSQHFLGEYNHGTLYRLALMVGMTAFWALAAPMYAYPNVGKKKRGIYFAMLPATKAEKHLSMVTFMVAYFVALMILGLVVDVLLTAVHVPGYTKYLWQSATLHQVDLPMLLGCGLAFLGSMFGLMFANTLQGKRVRPLVSGLMFGWLVAGLIIHPVMLDGEDSQWIVIAIEAVLTLFLAWLSRYRMDRMTY